MKTIYLLASVAVLGGTVACKKAGTYGSLVVQMTDAPAQFAAVNVDIKDVKVQYDDGKWVSLKTKSGIYNLLDLRNNVVAGIADKKGMPSGEIKTLKLELGADNSVKLISGTEISLKLPEGNAAVANLSATLHDEMTTTVLVDFDAEESVRIDPSGAFVLSPVLRIKDVSDNDDEDGDGKDHDEGDGCDEDDEEDGG
jgi:hypothetical protein